MKTIELETALDLTTLRGRKIDLNRKVWAYRNLRAGRHTPAVWSLWQSGRVVAHARACCLTDCEFRVRPSGRQRARRTGRRNVHAFCVGYLAPHGACGCDPRSGDLPVGLTYDPFGGDRGFRSVRSVPPRYPTGAEAVCLNRSGMTAAYLRGG